jgi:hypothetical protein
VESLHYTPVAQSGSINKVMAYILYKTTNLRNGKYYIGVSNGKNSSYKGSGTALKKALKYYGSENFSKEILETFDSEDKAFAREAEIVNQIFIEDRNTYNIKVGGKGGTGQQKTDSHKEKIRQSVLKSYSQRPPREYKSNPNSGRKPATDPLLLKTLVKENGIRKTAEILNISVSACQARYHRNK